MKLPLRIDFAANAVQWGRVAFTMTEYAKTGPRAFTATWTPAEFSASRVEVDVAAGILRVDGIAHHLRDWRVEGRVATAETEDFGPGYEAEMGE
jgi:hypothetical protein